MARIYIDTNVFLDFYQAATDRLEVFRALAARANSLLLTEQTIQEFRRNRVGRLAAVAKSIRERASISMHTTAVVMATADFPAWQNARDDAQRAARAVAAQVEAWMSEEASDPLLHEFDQVVAGAKILSTTEDAVARAQRRKLLGNPPTSPDKHTIGDELIWETILAQASDDLIVVSRDKTFLNNQELLRREYERGGSRRLLLVTEHLRSALELASASSQTIEVAEVALEAARSAGDARALETGACPRCGSPMSEDGFDGTDGDAAWWLECTACRYMVWGH